ncbi:MAG: SAM-dependent methyltransferase [Pyrinomonadaceae bacterium]|nr:SAM-dependent methyltransferase [Pyrinomonadaceae bacterium]
MQDKNKREFMQTLSASIAEGSFVKATFGNYRGNDPHLQKLLIRRLDTKKGRRLFVLFRFDTRDTAKNYDIQDGISLLAEKLGTEFYSGHLFTLENDFQLEIGKKGKSRLNRAKPTFNTMPETAHDRQKNNSVDPSSFFLKALGITGDSGKVKPRQHSKWKQINKFVETIGNLFDEAKINPNRPVRMVDMGSGKGYLTFAAYNYFVNKRGLTVEIIGVDANAQLVELSNSIATSCDFSGLSFRTGKIADFDIGRADILIALHACDTATDDALFKGISANASLILASPCCHKEIRPQMSHKGSFLPVLKHGALLETQAEIVTDTLRALLLESNGYKTRVFEFVPTEHTPKNNMIAAVRRNDSEKDKAAKESFLELKSEFGIKSQKLESLLS